MGALRFRGSQCLRTRLVLATLTGKSLRIDDIRANDVQPGLRDYEASLLRLLEKVTNGCVVEIDETGTTLRYRPGLITGGSGIVHECCPSRSVGYYLEPLLLLGMFGKKPLSITLRGVTNDGTDPGVDVFRTVTLPLMKRLGIEEGLELKVIKRGARPLGGGEVQLRVPNLRTLPPVNLVDEGMVKRIRGVSYSMKVSPQNTNRMVDGARGLLNKLLSDVYIFTDAVSGAASGLSPGYGLTLVAETTSGCLISAEACATTGGGSDGAGGESSEEPLLVPEDIGRLASQALLEEVRRGGVVDGSHQGLLLMLAALGPEELNQVRLGPLTPHAVRTLRCVRDVLGVTFHMKAEAGSGTIFLTAIGCGVKNREALVQCCVRTGRPPARLSQPNGTSEKELNFYPHIDMGASVGGSVGCSHSTLMATTVESSVLRVEHMALDACEEGSALDEVARRLCVEKEEHALGCIGERQPQRTPASSTSQPRRRL